MVGQHATRNPPMTGLPGLAQEAVSPLEVRVADYAAGVRAQIQTKFWRPGFVWVCVWVCVCVCKTAGWIKGELRDAKSGRTGKRRSNDGEGEREMRYGSGHQPKVGSDRIGR